MNILYTIEDMLKAFKIDQKTLYTWRKERGLPSIKIGKNVYFKKESVEQWLIEQEEKQSTGELS